MHACRGLIRSKLYHLSVVGNLTHSYGPNFYVFLWFFMECSACKMQGHTKNSNKGANQVCSNYGYNNMMHKSTYQCVSIYLVVQRDIFICISNALAARVFPVMAFAGDALVPASRVARARRASRTG